MKADRIFVLGATGVALAIPLVLGIDRVTPMPARLPLGQFLSAASAFVWEHRTTGRLRPDAVSLRELIAGGYLSDEHARNFAATEVSLSLNPDHRPPQAVRMHVKLADGYELALFNDGSVQAPSARNKRAFLTSF